MSYTTSQVGNLLIRTQVIPAPDPHGSDVFPSTTTLTPVTNKYFKKIPVKALSAVLMLIGILQMFTGVVLYASETEIVSLTLKSGVYIWGGVVVFAAGVACLNAVLKEKITMEQESQEDIFTSRPALPPLARKKKRSLDSATCSFLDKAASALQIKSDESDGFGVMTANKHRKMTDQQREFAERLVLEVLAKGIRGELSAKTKLIEEQPPTTYQAPMHFAQTQASNHQTGQWQYPSGQVHSSPWGPTYTNI